MQHLLNIYFLLFQKMLSIKENETYDVMIYNAVLLNSLCMPNVQGREYMSVKQFLDNECTPIPVILLIGAGLVVTIILVSVAVAIICARKARKAMEEASLGECSTRSFSTMNTHAGPCTPGLNKNVFYDCEGNPSWIMAVPEVKTYQETEVHVTYEESHPIQSSARCSFQDRNMLAVEKRNLTRQSCPFN